MAYGMHCVQCDGNDLFAVAKVVRDAAELARTKNRPTFIEALTYRLGDHTTADDARRYRDQAEVDAWKKRDPLIRLRVYLMERKLWDDAKEKAIAVRAKEEVAATVRRTEEIADPNRVDMFDSLYATLWSDLEAQRRVWRTSGLGLDPSQLEDASASGIEEAV